MADCRETYNSQELFTLSDESRETSQDLRQREREREILPRDVMKQMKILGRGGFSALIYLSLTSVGTLKNYIAIISV